MKQTIFRWLALLILLTFVAVAPATAEEGQIYTVKKGDTLWDLSQRFIDDPYYWPNVWSHNPDITNPHLIFPGQKLRILDGRLEIIPAYSESEQTATETAATTEQSAPQEVVTIRSTGSGDGFILTNEQALGTVVDSVDNRVLLTKGDLIFVKMVDPAAVQIGDTYGLYQRGEEIIHPESKQPVGTMMYNLGFMQVTDMKGETVIAKIGRTYREVLRGAELFEYVPHRKELTLKRAVEQQGTLIASQQNKIAQGTDDIVYIDLGSEQQIETGNLLFISRPRQVSDELLKQAGDLDLPDEALGAAVVIEAKNRTSSALIIKSVNAIHVGDNITMVNE